MLLLQLRHTNTGGLALDPAESGSSPDSTRSGLGAIQRVPQGISSRVRLTFISALKE